jgi:hypothetical protein
VERIMEEGEAERKGRINKLSSEMGKEKPLEEKLLKKSVEKSFQE